MKMRRGFYRKHQQVESSIVVWLREIMILLIFPKSIWTDFFCVFLFHILSCLCELSLLLFTCFDCLFTNAKSHVTMSSVPCAGCTFPANIVTNSNSHYTFLQESLFLFAKPKLPIDVIFTFLKMHHIRSSSHFI